MGLSRYSKHFANKTHFIINRVRKGVKIAIGLVCDSFSPSFSAGIGLTWQIRTMAQIEVSETNTGKMMCT